MARLTVRVETAQDKPLAVWSAIAMYTCRADYTRQPRCAARTTWATDISASLSERISGVWEQLDEAIAPSPAVLAKGTISAASVIFAPAP